jgi:hypothetical protein
VQAFGPSNYTDGSQTSLWISSAVNEIAQRIVRDRTRALNDDLGQPPGHVIEKSPSTNQPSLEQEPVPAVPVKKTVVSADAPIVTERGTALVAACAEDSKP